MSVVVAVKDNENNCIWVGCDSKITAGNKISYMDNNVTSKLWRLNDFTFVGGCGVGRDVQLVQTNEVIPSIFVETNSITFDWLVNGFFDNVYELLNEHHRGRITEGVIDDGCLMDEFIVRQGDKCFAIDCSGYVEPIQDFLTIGSGGEVAYTYMSSHTDEPIVERITHAIESASKLTAFVGGDIIIACTKMELIEGDNEE